jgi:flagellar biosynthetic protein FliO
MEQLAAVAVVLLLLGASLWELRRRGFAGVSLARRGSGRRMECVERLSLGPQQVLHLVRMGEVELLVASSASGCTLLKSFGPGQSEAAR